MSNECKDRDLLAIEPEIFTGGGFDSQQMSAGTDGAISAATFTSASADFTSAKITAGMVLCVYSAVPAEARSYEIISVDSSTSLTVSILRADREADAVAPPAGSDLKYYINTFGPQVCAARDDLLERLRRISETDGIDPADFVDSARLRRAVAFAALAGIFTARSSGAVGDDANWIKAEFYRREHAAAVGTLRLARDLDGDGLADQTRSLSNVTLRRR